MKRRGDSSHNEQIETWIKYFKRNALAPLMRRWVPAILNEVHDSEVRSLRKKKKTDDDPRIGDEIQSRLKLRVSRKKKGPALVELSIAAEMVRALEFAKGNRLLLERLHKFFTEDYLAGTDGTKTVRYSGKNFTFQSLLSSRNSADFKWRSTQWANFYKKDLLIAICKRLGVTPTAQKRGDVLERIKSLPWPTENDFFYPTELALKNMASQKIIKQSRS